MLHMYATIRVLLSLVMLFLFGDVDALIFKKETQQSSTSLCMNRFFHCLKILNCIQLMITKVRLS